MHRIVLMILLLLQFMWTFYRDKDITLIHTEKHMIKRVSIIQLGAHAIFFPITK